MIKKALNDIKSDKEIIAEIEKRRLAREKGNLLESYKNKGIQYVDEEKKA